jgi:hypothetical protein
MQEISLLFRSKNESALLLLLMVMFACATITTNYRTTQFSLTNDRELSYITSQIAAHINSEKITRIHVIAAEDAAFMGHSTFFADDIANIILTAMQNIPHSKSLTVKNCTGQSIDETSRQSYEMKCIADLPQGVIAVTSNRFGFPVYPSPNMLIIDMNYEDIKTSSMHLGPHAD